MAAPDDDRERRRDVRHDEPALVEHLRRLGIPVRRERGRVGRVEAVMPAPRPTKPPK